MQCITNDSAVGGLASQLRFDSTTCSMFVILSSENFPLPNQASVDSLMIADSLILIAM